MSSPITFLIILEEVLHAEVHWIIRVITNYYSFSSCQVISCLFFKMFPDRIDRLDGVVVRASASQSVDLGFIPLVESYQNTLKNGIYSFPAWRSAFMGGCGEQAGKFACCVLGQGT